MRFILKLFFGLVFIALLLGGGFIGWLAYNYYQKPVVTAETAAVVLVEKGATLRQIATQMAEKGFIQHPDIAVLMHRYFYNNKPVKAGEYALEPGMTASDILSALSAGKSLNRSVTLIEGHTTWQLLQTLPPEDDKAMPGSLDPNKYPDGSLLPETYFYTHGEPKEAILGRMQTAMQETLEELWQNRAPDLPITSKKEALILASIVEKETGIGDERPLVASVFLNRMRKGMPLQSDPTVIYALTKGRMDLGRPLLRKDWQYENPYNTYTNNGLPPGAICHPSRASIEAVLQPVDSPYFYFVATGNGGHRFARTLTEHNKNVQDFYRSRGTP